MPRVIIVRLVKGRMRQIQALRRGRRKPRSLVANLTRQLRRGGLLPYRAPRGELALDFGVRPLLPDQPKVHLKPLSSAKVVRSSPSGGRAS